VAPSLPLALVPGLLCSARLYAPQIAALWPFGPVTVADHRRDDDIAAVAARILSEAPPHFALAGLSIGGYVAFAMLRLAPERIAKLALLDTSARPDTPEQTAARHAFITMVEGGELDEVVDTLAPCFVHSNRLDDAPLMRIVRDIWPADTGPEAFVRQERAIISRPDLRPLLASINCPTLVLTGDGDELTPPELAKEIAGGITAARLVIAPDCGHLSTIERPDAVDAAPAAWLEA
jgi:pimeloyl-ACP methyl ester carboxylesterase